jgi:hypothetical protein
MLVTMKADDWFKMMARAQSTTVTGTAGALVPSDNQ